MTVFYLPRDGAKSPAGSAATPGFRVGFTVSRALGDAVQRNRMRRRLREAVRLCRPASELAVDIVINPKRSLLAAKFTGVQEEVTRAFTVISQKCKTPQPRTEN